MQQGATIFSPDGRPMRPKSGRNLWRLQPAALNAPAGFSTQFFVEQLPGIAPNQWLKIDFAYCLFQDQDNSNKVMALATGLAVSPSAGSFVDGHTDGFSSPGPVLSAQAGLAVRMENYWYRGDDWVLMGVNPGAVITLYSYIFVNNTDAVSHRIGALFCGRFQIYEEE